MRFWKLAARLVTLSLGLAIASPAMAVNVADLGLAFTIDESSTATTKPPLEPPIAMTYGGKGDYSMTVSNAGPNRAPNVQITGTVPAETSLDSATGCTLTTVKAADGTTSLDFPCVIGDINENTTQDVVITLSLDPPKPTPTTCPGSSLGAVSFAVASVAAAATATTPAVPASTDPGGASDVLAVGAGTTTIQPIADLSVTLDGPATASAGDLVTYTGTVKNVGPCPAALPRVAWTTAGNLELQQGGDGPAGAPAPGCDATWGDFNNNGGAKNRCVLAPLASGASVTFSRVFKVSKPPSEVTATATPVNLTTSSGTAPVSSKVPGSTKTRSVVASTDLKSSNNSADFQTAIPGNTGCSSTGGAVGLVTVLGLLGLAVLRRRRG